MPVGTQATVKTVSPRRARGGTLGAPIILSNTYHLYLRPGADLRAGRACTASWGGPPDPHRQRGLPGLQPGASRRLDEEGGVFQSHRRQPHFFTPERAMEIQEQLGADIIMAFDVCTASPADED